MKILICIERLGVDLTEAPIRLNHLHREYVKENGPANYTDFKGITKAVLYYSDRTVTLEIAPEQL